MTSTQPQYRHEIKYLINHVDYHALREKLRTVLKPDPYASQGPYFVRSLYFDSIDNDDLSDKANGVTEKKKVRMRIYGLADTKVSFQIKHSNRDLIFKESAWISKALAKQISQGNHYDSLLTADSETLKKLFVLFSTQQYRPVTLIDYWRDAFMLEGVPDLRITFDHHVTRSDTDLALFAKAPHMKPLFKDDAVVLEIKYHRVLPNWIKSLLFSNGSTRLAVSKYYLARTT